MTVSSVVVTAGPTSTNGVTTVFGFTFRVDAYNDVTQKSQVVVTRVLTSTGAETVLTVDSDYTISFNADQDASPGGSVTISPAPASGYKLYLRAAPSLLQSIELQDQGAYNASTVEAEMDNLAKGILDLNDRLAGAPYLGVQKGSSFSGKIAGPLTAGYVPIVNGTLDGWLLGAPVSAAVSAAMLPVVLASTIAAATALEDAGNPFTDVASAATVDLGAVASNKVRITGLTGPITSFGTAAAGTRKLVRLASTPTIAYNGTSLILPGDASIVGQPDDEFEAVSLGSGNWYVGLYQRGGYPPATNSPTLNAVTSAATLAAGQVAFGIREQLTGNRTYTYDPAGNGADFTSLNVAWATIYETLDLRGYSVTVNGPSTTTAVTEFVMFQGGWCVGQTEADQVYFNLSHCDLSHATFPAIACIGARVKVTTKSLASTSSIYPAVQSYRLGQLWLAPGEFKTSTVGHMQAAGGAIIIQASYTVSGGSTYHGLSEVGQGNLDFGTNTVTLTGTPAFSSSFLEAAENSYIAIHTATFTGSATGIKYKESGNGRVVPIDPDQNINALLPGSINGVSKIRATQFQTWNGAFKTSVTSAATADRAVALPDKAGTLAFSEGTTTNDNAATGQTGEFVESTVLVGSSVSVTTATDTNITSISLGAGDWEVWGSIGYTPDTTTLMTTLNASINTVSATQPTAPAGGAFTSNKFTYGAGQPQIISAGRRRISLSGAGTAYLIARAIFTTSTLTAYGYIGARRIR